MSQLTKTQKKTSASTVETKGRPSTLNDYGPFRGQRVFRWKIQGKITWAPTYKEALERISK